MKVCLYTFTGTGNTKICGEFLRKYFEEYGATVDHYVFNSNNLNHPNPNDYDLIGIGYPIHAFNVPEVFVNFLKKLENVDHKKLFIYKVSGEPFHFNDSSSYHVYKYLKKKGYELILEKHFIMPYNIMFDYDIRLKKQMYLYLDALCKMTVIRLMNGEEDNVVFPFSSTLLSFIARIEWLAPKLNSPFVKVNEKKCINCNMCINNCPTEAMYRNDKNKIKIHASKCAMCMRCTLNCPTNAINYGFMNSWKVNGRFDYKKIANNDEIDPCFVNQNTKGYFKTFRKYFNEQNHLLEKYNIKIPVEYSDENKFKE